MVVELSATFSIVSAVCVHDTVVCISSSKQRINIATVGLMTAVSVVCVVSII